MPERVKSCLQFYCMSVDSLVLAYERLMIYATKIIMKIQIFTTYLRCEHSTQFYLQLLQLEVY